MSAVSDAPTKQRHPFWSSIENPFGRLALTHVLSAGGDALVAISLAGSLFFSVDPAAARWRIALYLIFTMAPFAIVGPLIGPALDRWPAARQWMLRASTMLRGAIALMMTFSVASNSLWLFPQAFMMLVLAKSYAVAKASAVPVLVQRDEDLVAANSKLQVLAGIAAFGAGVPGALLMLLTGPSGVTVLCSMVFVGATVAAWRVPTQRVDTAVAVDLDSVAEPRSVVGDAIVSDAHIAPSILVASSAMGALRWCVGFATFLFAFALRGADQDPPGAMKLGRLMGEIYDAHGAPVEGSDLVFHFGPPVWHFGVIVALSGIGTLLGASLAPQLRALLKEEEKTLQLALLGGVLAGLSGLVLPGILGQSGFAFLIAIAASVGKQSFDSIVQRDSAEIHRGRAFARFESRFQVIWVFGAAVPVLIMMPTALGGLLVGATSGASLLLYWSAARSVDRGQPPVRLPSVRDVRKMATDKRASTLNDNKPKRQPHHASHPDSTQQPNQAQRPEEPQRPDTT